MSAVAPVPSGVEPNPQELRMTGIRRRLAGESLKEIGIERAEWKTQGRKFFADPLSSKAAHLFAVFIVLLIIASSIALALSTIPSYENFPWVYIEYISNICFTLEIVARFLVADNFREIYTEVRAGAGPTQR